jgi:virginiamycin B lyase
MTMKQKRLKILAVFFIAFLSLAAGGTDRVSIKEWEVPSPATFPHDPAVGPDGSLWYTGIGINVLGRLDQSTGSIKEYPLKTPASGPHGLAADKEGSIWFTANFKGYIGKLDPQTGEVTEYPMPDPAARDPHSLVFDGGGLLWFTVQTGNFVGRLDPRTGIITLKPSPTLDSRPYGISVNSKGIPFFCEFGTNKIGSIDPETMKITEYLLPKGARPRRTAFTRDDVIYYTDYHRGYLGRLDPKSGRVDEWPSPGGNSSRPYGLTITPNGMVWYSESGVEPNTLVRFDPTTRRFSKWNVPSGGGVIRNMAATSGGDIYIACSGVNKVGIVRVEH